MLGEAPETFLLRVRGSQCSVRPPAPQSVLISAYETGPLQPGADQLLQEDDAEFIAKVERHRADERKHYVMFKRWFELRGTRPLAVDRMFGHIDRFVEIMFGRTIDGLDTKEVIARDELFERLCRVISLTEQRGYKILDDLAASVHPVAARQNAHLARLDRDRG